jgi:3-hydroxyisobutyrate dehydrogenase
MTAVGIVGTGRMGTAFAKRLLECGREVHVWNRTADRTAEAVRAEAKAEGDLAGLAAACEVIITSLTDFTAADAIYRQDGLLSPAVEGKLLIEMSTLLPKEQEILAARVADAGAEFLECPVGGTVAPALKGQLLGIAGGSEAAFERASPILNQLCKRVEHLGPAGCGARMKLAVNLPLAIYWSVLGEAMKLLEGSGISPERAISIIADSSAGPTVLKNRAQVVIDTLEGQDQPGTFDIAGLAKDLRLALREAGEMGSQLPISEAVLAAYEDALSVGLGGYDGASLTRHLAQGRKV